ncbi:MAG: wax ester/triacylglycerol synthase family O-acyltransferase [Solirubrobacterales bacterium]|nr:wax ester/triacylglycerol synthase family O-acyltransferase [Solirubrobacterales bacterium]
MSATQPMTHADAAWLHMDQPTNLMVITGVLWFESCPDWDRVRGLIQERFVDRYPRFRQRVVEGLPPLTGPHWEDAPDFNLDLHLHHVALPEPRDRTALTELVADITATPLDPAKPLWQMHLVDGYGDGAAMIHRIHHCIADGIALSRVLLSLADESPEPGVGDSGVALQADQDEGGTGGPIGAIAGSARGAASAVVGAAGALAHQSLEVARNPSHMLDLATATRDEAETVAKVLFQADDPKTALKGEMGVAKGVSWSAPIPLEEVRDLGHATGTTINDVVMTAVTGAFRRYLDRRDDLVDELTAMVPFNLRAVGEPLPATLGNRFGLVFLNLPTGTSGRKGRLAMIHENMKKIKTSHEGVVSYGVIDAMGRTPERVERRVIDLFTAKGSAVVTNVPGPTQPVFLAGTLVAGVLVWAPCSGNVSMTISIFSYNGKLTVGLMADADLIPDPDELVADFEHELQALLDLDPA